MRVVNVEKNRVEITVDLERWSFLKDTLLNVWPPTVSKTLCITYPPNTENVKALLQSRMSHQFKSVGKALQSCI